MTGPTPPAGGVVDDDPDDAGRGVRTGGGGWIGPVGSTTRTDGEGATPPVDALAAGSLQPQRGHADAPAR